MSIKSNGSIHFLISLLLLALGCSGESNWATYPRFASKIDTTAHFTRYYRFTMMPFESGAKQINDLGPGLAQSLLSTTKACFEQRGYLYTEILDSADFILQIDCKDGYNIAKELEPLIEYSPPLTLKKPLRLPDLIDTSFTPIPRDLWFQLSSPLLFVYAYDRNSVLIGQWVAGAEQRNGNYEEASRKLIDALASTLPSRLPWLIDPVKVSPGIIGFYADQNRQSGFLEVKTIVEHSPADYGGLMEGDQLLKLDTINLKNYSYETFRSLNSGDPGAIRKYLIHRKPDTTFTLTFTMAKRDTIGTVNRKRK